MGLEEPLIGGSKGQGTPLQGGVFVLANTILGAGMLGLPFAIAACGYLVGGLMLAAFACCSMTALVLLSECADHVGRPATFNSVAEMAIPGAGIYFDFAIAIKCFGVATSYLIVIGDSVPKAVVHFGASGILLQRRFWTLAALLVAGPLAYMRKLTALRHVSLVALTCVLGITVMIILMAVDAAFDFDNDFDAYSECKDLAECKGPTYLYTTPMQTLHALPLFVFSYTCHQNVFSITNELDKPTRTRSALVCVIAVSVALTVYVFLGGAGYYTFGSLVEHDILSSYPADNGIVSTARLAISLVVTCCYPLQAHPCRACVTTIVKKVAPGLVDETLLHVGITTVFLIATGSIAFVVSDLGLILSVVGATGSTIISCARAPPLPTPVRARARFFLPPSPSPRATRLRA